MPSPIEVLMHRVDGGGAERDARPLIHPMAQADQCARLYAELQNAPALEPGQLCREREGFRSIKGKLRMVFVVLRRLDHQNEFDRQLVREWLGENRINLTAMMPDVVCGAVGGSAGHCMLYSLHYSPALSLVTAGELADWPLPPAGEED